MSARRKPSPTRTPAGDLRRADQRYLGRDSPADDLQVVSAEGSRVTDVHGRTYVDFTGGWCTGNLGWAQPQLRERLRRFHGPDYVLPGSLYAPWVEVARLLAELAPGKLVRSYRAATGTEAVELALQLARNVTGRKKLVKLADAYHGNSMGVQDIPGVVAPPLDERALGKLETVLRRRDVAAFIMEPIVTSLGVALPTTEFVRGARALCRRYGTLLVADEVATGFGRTGALFASQHFDLEPDLMCLAKALTSGHAPMGATLVTAEVADAVDGLDFYSTYGWHPLACEAALATLQIWRDRGDALLAAVGERSEQLAARLAGLTAHHVEEVRVKGLAIGVDLDDDTDVDDLVERCRHAGLLVTGEDGTLMLFPALTIDRATADRGLDLLEEVLTAHPRARRPRRHAA